MSFMFVETEARQIEMRLLFVLWHRITYFYNNQNKLQLQHNANFKRTQHTIHATISIL